MVGGGAKEITSLISLPPSPTVLSNYQSNLAGSINVCELGKIICLNKTSVQRTRLAICNQPSVWYHTSKARQIALQWIGVNKRHCANLWIGLYTVDNCWITRARGIDIFLLCCWRLEAYEIVKKLICKCGKSVNFCEFSFVMTERNTVSVYLRSAAKCKQG